MEGASGKRARFARTEVREGTVASQAPAGADIVTEVVPAMMESVGTETLMGRRGAVGG